MMRGVHPHLLAEATIDVVGEGETMAQDFVEEAEGADPLVNTMMTIITEVGEMVVEIVTEMTTNLNVEKEGVVGVAETITVTTMTTDLRDRVREADLEWDVEEGEEVHTDVVGVVADGRTKEEDTIIVETTGAEVVGEKE